MTRAADMLSLRPFGGFDFIMADPPWRFELHSEAGEGRAPQAHYDCMALVDIQALPVEGIAAKDCLLWLWAINPMLPQALIVLDSWGFTFKTAGSWCKRTKHGKDAFGTGYVLRSSNEPFLIATRGAPKTTKSTRSTIPTYDDWFHADGCWPAGSITIEGRTRAHSQKPEECFAAAEGLMPVARRIELFSRTNRPGWTSWGAEVGKLNPTEEVA
ncbi:N6-adenosine-specific RNA methylase IME4 [Loktanella atrilutea]|uniref:N6-adenosine-specific RNA methylase IME4 n=1 Tax=Loktanella atrilutea TaxID=366533 RepID=A0A1M5DJ70_LOKAT|nr:MT-A70 family methyltransferase [Loktanella atrilutea]SHF67000.1 N6-adenosine-specific RNA methylase IME4 [Loktanella atrilutea]